MTTTVMHFPLGVASRASERLRVLLSMLPTIADFVSLEPFKV